jgi:hypothetical protein
VKVHSAEPKAHHSQVGQVRRKYFSLVEGKIVGVGVQIPYPSSFGWTFGEGAAEVAWLGPKRTIDKSEKQDFRRRGRK